MARGIPDEVSMNAERHALAQRTSRMKVELGLVDEWCLALKPSYFSSPEQLGTEIDGIVYDVKLTEGRLFDKDTVRLEMIIPEEYPSEIPRIYIPGLSKDQYDSKAHMYRDRQHEIHMCIFFPEDWTEDHTIAGMMIRSTIWINKYVEYKRSGSWPGKGQAHCSKCGNRTCQC